MGRDDAPNYNTDFITINIDSTIEPKKNPKQKKKTNIYIGTEDIIAIFAGIIALAFALAIIFGKLPVNYYTIGVIGFSGAGGVITKIISAKKNEGTKDKPS